MGDLLICEGTVNADIMYAGFRATYCMLFQGRLCLFQLDNYYNRTAL